MESFDVVVIGAGAMGSATAWHLARAGRRVLLCEQFDLGHRRGSSHGGVRIFRHAYPDPTYVAMAAAALPIWRDLEHDAGETLLELTGCYDHGPRRELTPIADALSVHGIRHEWLSPVQAAERTPGLRFDEAVLHHPDAGRCFADRTLAALQRRCREHGAEIVAGTPARVRLVDGAAGPAVDVDIADRTVRARTAVVAAGAWVEHVLTGVVDLPRFVVTQEQVVHFAPHDATAVWPSFIHHAAPFRYGLHTPGEGLKVGGHHEGPPTTADERGFDLDPDIVTSIVDYVDRWVPGVDPTPRFGATCLYTTTDDEHFVVDRVGPVVVGSPCSGHGFKFTPLIGQLLAALATDPDAVGAADRAGIVPAHRLS